MRNPAVLFHDFFKAEKTGGIDIFWLKMPLDKGSAAMSFQVGFKSVGFFFVFKGNRIFDAPRTKFGCVQHITFVMFFQTGFQVFGTANVKMSSACFINENVYVMKVRHQARIFQNNV